jgi:hypothetical protein
VPVRYGAFTTANDDSNGYGPYSATVELFISISIKIFGLNGADPKLEGKKLYFVHDIVTGDPLHTILLYILFVKLNTLYAVGVTEAV